MLQFVPASMATVIIQENVTRRFHYRYRPGQPEDAYVAENGMVQGSVVLKPGQLTPFSWSLLRFRINALFWSATSAHLKSCVRAMVPSA